MNNMQLSKKKSQNKKDYLLKIIGKIVKNKDWQQKKEFFYILMNLTFQVVL